MRHRVKARWIGGVVALGCGVAMALWWHDDEVSDAVFDRQTAASQCYHRYDGAAAIPAGTPSNDVRLRIETAEAQVDRCYAELDAALAAKLAELSWWPSVAAGMAAALGVWALGFGVTWVAGRRT